MTVYGGDSAGGRQPASLDATIREYIREEIEKAKVELGERPLTVPQVAAYFGVVQTTVHGWRKLRDPRLRLRMYNIGDGNERGCWRVDVSELERFKEERSL